MPIHALVYDVTACLEHRVLQDCSCLHVHTALTNDVAASVLSRHPAAM